MTKYKPSKMNLRSRIQKLEKGLISPENRFCDCWMIHYKKMIDLVYDEIPYDYDSVALPEGNFCQSCKKEVSGKDLSMQRNLLLVYGGDL